MKQLTFLLLFLVLQTSVVQAHFETVATLEFTHHDGKFYVKASLEKRQLAVALAHEADCVPKDMMNICAERYLRDHIKLKLNGKSFHLVQEGLQLQKGYLILTYRVDNIQSVESIDIDSDYMLDYDSHAITKYVLQIDENIRYFSTKNQLRKITIKNKL
jgi:hypothetical protein